MPSAATSDGSHVERSMPGVLAMNPSDATARSIRKQFTAIDQGCSWRARSTVRRSSPILEMPYDMTPGCG